jgi:hypothetical protein
MVEPLSLSLSKSFRKYLRHRLLSSDRRFYQMCLKRVSKTILGIQVAPAGSLAWKAEIKGPDWKVSGPDVTALAEEFFDGRKPGFVPKESVIRTALKWCHFFKRKSPTRERPIPNSLVKDAGSLKNRIPAIAIIAAPPARIIGTADSGPPFWNNKKNKIVPTPTQIPVRTE